MFAATSCSAFGQSSTNADESSVAAATPTTDDRWCYDTDEHVRSAVEELSSYLVDPLSLTIYDIWGNDNAADDGLELNIMSIDYGARDRHGALGRYRAEVYVSFGLSIHGQCRVAPYATMLNGVYGDSGFVEKGSWPTVPTTVDPRTPWEICDIGDWDLTVAEYDCLSRHGVFDD